MQQDLFRCTVRGKTKEERDAAAYLKARNHYLDRPFRLVRTARYKEIEQEGSWQQLTSQEDYLFIDESDDNQGKTDARTV